MKIAQYAHHKYRMVQGVQQNTIIQQVVKKWGNLFFSSETILTVTIKFTSFMKKILHYFSIKSPSLSTHSSTFARDTVCRSCKTVHWSTRVLHARCVAAHCLRKMASLDCILQATKKVEVGGTKLGLYGEWRLYSASCLAKPFEFIALTSRMSVYITLNWLRYLSSRIQLTKFIHCPRRC